jgi:hypothetical protein
VKDPFTWVGLGSVLALVCFEEGAFSSQDIEKLDATVANVHTAIKRGEQHKQYVPTFEDHLRTLN